MNSLKTQLAALFGAVSGAIVAYNVSDQNGLIAVSAALVIGTAILGGSSLYAMKRESDESLVKAISKPEKPKDTALQRSYRLWFGLGTAFLMWTWSVALWPFVSSFVLGESSDVAADFVAKFNWIALGFFTIMYALIGFVWYTGVRFNEEDTDEMLQKRISEYRTNALYWNPVALIPRVGYLIYRNWSVVVSFIAENMLIVLFGGGTLGLLFGQTFKIPFPIGFFIGVIGALLTWFFTRRSLSKAPE